MCNIVCIKFKRKHKIVAGLNNKNKDQKSVETLKTVLRLGHEAFARGDLHAAAIHILNNTRTVLKYDRACLVNTNNRRVRIVAVTNQSEVNSNSEYCLEMTALVKGLFNVDKITILNKEYFVKNNLSKEAEKAFDYFEGNGVQIVAVPLFKPGTENFEEKFFWIIEFYNEISESSLNIIHLLSLHYRESVWFYYINKKSLLTSLFKSRKRLSPGRAILCLLVLFIIISFFKVSHNVAADFELVPYDEITEYAPYAGMIKSVSFNSGDMVKKGDIVLEYDTQELSYKLLETKTSYDKISAELDWNKQQSFNNTEQLGNVKVLVLQQEAVEIEIEKNEWYIKNAKIKADISGVFVLNETEKWVGKAVTAGEKLFEIIPPNKINAEIMLDEQSASVIDDKMNITLYLYSCPEMPIHGKILSASPRPMLTKTGQFCYLIKMKLHEIDSNFIVGMRGIARVSGEKVSIGYYLFKNLVLWWRKI